GCRNPERSPAYGWGTSTAIPLSVSSRWRRNCTRALARAAAPAAGHLQLFHRQARTTVEHFTGEKETEPVWNEARKQPARCKMRIESPRWARTTVYRTLVASACCLVLPAVG